MRLQSLLLVALVATFAGCVAQSEAAAKENQADPGSLPPIDENEARITGTVTDDSLAPIRGAQVGVLNSDPLVMVTTNEAGRFAIVGLAPGPYTLQIQQLGFLSVTKQIETVAGQAVDITVALVPISVATGDPRSFTIIGEGYFACGADTPVVTWGNLHACLWDNHKPNISFEVPKADFMGLMDEVVWTQSSGLTSQRLSVSIGYRQVCSPFCSTAQSYGGATSASPVRFYVDAVDDQMAERIPEDPMPLKSITFPDRDDQQFVIVFQQRMTHYITLFWGQGSSLEEFTAIPDA